MDKVGYYVFKGLFGYSFLILFFVMKNKKNKESTNMHVWFPLFCFEKYQEHKKTLNLENNNGFHRAPKLSFMFFQKLFFLKLYFVLKKQ